MSVFVPHHVSVWYRPAVTAPVPLDELRRQLAAVVGDRRVSTREPDRAHYARDMWPRLLLGLRDGAPAAYPPDLVVWPHTVEEIRDVVALARKLHVPLVPYGAGSGVAGGALPLFGGITLDLKRMDRILAVDEGALTVEAEAGINGERLERDLDRRGYTLGHFPSSIYCSTLGGWLAARSGGQMSTKYGKIEDMVLGVTAVTGRGEIVTTGRHGRATSGPDWTQLLVGSEGTLGVIASARLRIHRRPEVRHLRGFEFPRLTAGLEAIRRVLQRGLRPAVVRLYDEFDSAMNFARGDHTETRRPGAPPIGGRSGQSQAPLPGHGALPDIPIGVPARDDGPLAWVRTLVPGLGGAGKRILQAGLGVALERPRLLNALLESAATSLSRHGCLLIVGVEGGKARADVEADLVWRELSQAGGKDLGTGPGERWLSRRYAVSYEMPKMFSSGAFVDTMEVASTWERLLDLYTGVRRAIGEHAFVMAHFSHAYPEGCSIYFTFAGHAPNRAAAERKYDAIWRDGLAAATRAGGTISHHHGVGLLKAPFMADEHRESMALYQAVKDTLDPEGICNPGKMGLKAPRDLAGVQR
jgi:alkyldihydroxyacetonephosphate synthase